MNHSLRNLLLAIGLFAIALACCIACTASVNVFACALGLAVLPALWMLTGKAELFFAAAYPLTIFLLTRGGEHVRGPVGILAWLTLIHWDNPVPFLQLCEIALVPATLLCLAAIYRSWSKPLSGAAWLWVLVFFLLYIKNRSLELADYLTYLPAGVLLVLHSAMMIRSHRSQTLSTND